MALATAAIVLSSDESDASGDDSTPAAVGGVDCLARTARTPQKLKKHTFVDATEDNALLQLRQELLHHVEAFNTKPGLDFDRLVKRYRGKTRDWSANAHIDMVLKHAVHVCAWIRFGTRVFERDREVVLETLASLLGEMLDARGQVQPHSQLVRALRFVAEFCEDFFEYTWAMCCLQKIQRALADCYELQTNATPGPAPTTGRQPGTPASTRCKHGTYGRTDQALVRRVLGNRVHCLPDGVKIYWDGLQQRWYATKNGNHWRGSNAKMSRFDTDEVAIDYVFDIIMRGDERPFEQLVPKRIKTGVSTQVAKKTKTKSRSERPK